MYIYWKGGLVYCQAIKLHTRAHVARVHTRVSIQSTVLTCYVYKRYGPEEPEPPRPESLHPKESNGNGIRT